jgi:hypothetical protein
VGRGKIEVDDRLTGAIAVRTRSFVGLRLKGFQDVHRLTRRGNNAEFAVRPGEHQPRSGDVKDFDASVREKREEVDDVEAFDQGVGKLDQRAGQQDFSGRVSFGQLGLLLVRVPTDF